MEAINRAYRISNSDSPYAADHKLIYEWLTEHAKLEAEINRLRLMIDLIIKKSGCPFCGRPDCSSFSFDDWNQFLDTDSLV